MSSYDDGNEVESISARKSGRIGVPVLTVSNWTDFKPKFLNSAQRFGLAGTALLTGVEPPFVLPDIKEVLFPIIYDAVLDNDGDPVLDGDGVPRVKARRKYPEDEFGRAIYMEDLKLVKRQQGLYPRDRQQLVESLMSSVDEEVETNMRNDGEFERCYRNYSILELWRIAENAATGQGAVAIHTTVTRLLNIKQDRGKFAVYLQEFNEIVATLMRLGNADELLQTIFNTLFVTRADQEEFGMQIAAVKGTVKWRNYQDLGAEWRVYSSTTKGLMKLEKSEGLVKANYTPPAPGGAPGGGGPRRNYRPDFECHNCGQSGVDHSSYNCPEPMHRCRTCGRNHLEKYCYQNGSAGNGRARQEGGAGRGNGDRSGHSNPPRPDPSQRPKAHPPASNKSQRRTNVLRKASKPSRAHLADEAEDQDYDDADEDDDFSDDETLNACVVHIADDEEVTTALPGFITDVDFIVDSGCNNAHLTKHPEILLNAVETDTSSIQGVTGHRIQCTHRGSLPVPGKAIAAPEADANLLALKLLCKNGGSFSGNFHELNVYDAAGKLIVPARDDGCGFWTVSLMTLQDCHDSDAAVLARPAIHERHFSAEQMARARSAFNLCALCGHPGDSSLMRSLDNGNFRTCDLTSQDLRNARELFGRCAACVEAKMQAPATTSSTSPPAAAVGEHLHMDFIILRGTSLGGNKMIAVFVCEYSGMLVGVPTPSKSEKLLKDVFMTAVAYFNQYGHKVERITFDSEPALICMIPHLQRIGIHASGVAAGHHECRIERYIQTIKARKRAMLASLPYVLPPALEGEAFMCAIHSLNRVSNSVSHNMTPYQLVTGTKPALPSFYFGQVGVFYMRRQDAPDDRSEWGIFIAHVDEQHGHYRAYIPTRQALYSKRRFAPMESVPAEWQLPTRIRLIAPKTDPAPVLDLKPSPVLPAARVNMDVQSQLPLQSSPSTVAAPRSTPEGDGFSRDSSRQEGEYGESAAATSSLPAALSSPEKATREPEQPSTSPEKVDRTPSLEPTSSPPTVPALPEKLTRVPAKPSSSSERVDQAPSFELRSSPSLVPIPGITQEGGTTPAEAPRGDGRPRRTSAQVRDYRKANSSGFFTSGDPGFNSTGDPGGSSQVRKIKFKADRILEKHGKDRHKAFHRSKAGKRLINFVNNCSTSKFFRVSVKKALSDPMRAKAAKRAILDEIDNMVLGDVMRPVMFSDIPFDCRGDILNAFMFLKDKFLASGEFEKIKARLVTNGKEQKPDTVGETAAPTVNPTSVMIQLNLAAADPEVVMSAYDIKGAFLVTPLEAGRRIFLRITADVAALWVEAYPAMRKHLSAKGLLYFELNKYLYGLQDAPHAFNGYLDAKLHMMGFKPTLADPCLYTKTVSDGKLILSVHVDDLLLTAPSKSSRSEFESELAKIFQINTQHDNISYLGMSIRRLASGAISVKQTGYIANLLEKCGCVDPLAKPPSTPATSNLMDHDPHSPPCNATRFLSIIMSMMFLARLTRPDILLPVSYLATRSSSPTEEDLGKLMRIARYLNGTRDVGLVYMAPDLRARFYVDASHGIHVDGHGQAGLLITLGSAPIFCRSTKIKSITRSSSESELVALEDASTYVVWIRALLWELRNDDRTVEVFQDNKSTIIMAVQGGSFKRMKHLVCKEGFVKERIAAGEMKISYLPTGSMLADMLTKPLEKVPLQRLLRILRIK